MCMKCAFLSAWTFAATLLFAETASAQTVVDPSQLPATVRNLDPNQAHEALPCSVKQIEPSLDFGLRLQTGYVLQVPVGLYSGAGHHWYLVFRVTPENNSRSPVYFMDSVDIPAVFQPESVAAVRGLFLVGEGRYDVSFSMLDDLGRVCRQKWTLDAKLDKNDHTKEAMLPPGTAAGVSLPQARTLLPNSRAQPRRITVVLNTLPAAPRIVRLGKPDGVEWLLSKWGILVSMLTSLLEQNPSDSVRVVGLDLAGQRETVLRDGFTLKDINGAVHLGDVMDRARIQLPSGTYLQQSPTAMASFLADVVNREIHAEPPPDDVIFMGTPMGAKIPPRVPVPTIEASPRFFYLQYRPNSPGLTEEYNRVPSAGTPDFISQPMLANAGPPLDIVGDYVKRLNARTFTVYSPSDFRSALKKIDLAIH
jgi:hypothetical protein